MRQFAGYSQKRHERGVEPRHETENEKENADEQER